MANPTALWEIPVAAAMAFTVVVDETVIVHGFEQAVEDVVGIDPFVV